MFVVVGSGLVCNSRGMKRPLLQEEISSHPKIGRLVSPCGGRPKTLVYILYRAETCEKQNQCFSVVAKDPLKHGERAGERVI